MDQPGWDVTALGTRRNRLWNEVRKAYPTKMDPGQLEHMTLKEDDNVVKFIHEYQDKWKEETGGTWDETDTSKGLFKLMLKKCLPKCLLQVQSSLDEVVGLNSMP